MEKRFCIFGDSVTQAGYVKAGWVELLKYYLEKKYPNDDISVCNLGINGDTVDNILKRFETEAAPRYPTDIIFAVGINDTKSYNEKTFTENVHKLISLAKKFTSKITFIGLVLGDWSGGEPFSQKRTANYNRIIKELVEANNYEFIPLQDKITAQDFMDGLHPNNSGHRKMFEEIKKYF